MSDAIAQSGHQIADGPTDFGPLAAATLAMGLKPLNQLIDLVRIFIEVGAAFLRRLIDFLAVLRLLFRDQAHVLEQGQGRVDHAGARRIFAAGHFLDRLDELIAMARLIDDQLEQYQAELATFENPLLLAAAAPPPPAAPPPAPRPPPRPPPPQPPGPSPKSMWNPPGPKLKLRPRPAQRWRPFSPQS